MEMNKPEYTKKDMWWAVSKTAVATFILAGIFFRFLAVETTQLKIIKNQEDLKVLIKATDDYTNERIDKKTDRNKMFIDANKKEIDILIKPNSDKK